jgi:hypothetical protein
MAKASTFGALVALALSIGSVAVASDFRESEWILDGSDCAERPAISYAILGPNFIVRPTSTCIFDPVEFSVLFKTGSFLGSSRCFFSEERSKELWDHKAKAEAAGEEYPEGLWDIAIRPDGTLAIGDGIYKQCPGPLNLPR